MPADFSKAENGLHRCHVRVFHGFIFVNLSEGAPVDFDATFADLGPYLDFHGFADARIAHAESYPTTANWKLVVENFVECYHCAPSHPEFTSMHPPQALIAFGAGPSSGPAEAVDAYLPVLKAWEARAAALGRPIGTIDDGPDSSHLRLLLQRTIREGFETETEDGKPGRHSWASAPHSIRGACISRSARSLSSWRRTISPSCSCSRRAARRKPTWTFTGWSTARLARSMCPR
jgi:Rieske 2Fe-2S family protein